MKRAETVVKEEMTYEEAYNIIKRLKLHSSLEKEAEFEEAKNLALRALNNGQRVFVQSVDAGEFLADEEYYKEIKEEVALKLIKQLEENGFFRVEVNQMYPGGYIMTGEIRL